MTDPHDLDELASAHLDGDHLRRGGGPRRGRSRRCRHGSRPGRRARRVRRRLAEPPPVDPARRDAAIAAALAAFDEAAGTRRGRRRPVTPLAPRRGLSPRRGAGARRRGGRRCSSPCSCPLLGTATTATTTTRRRSTSTGADHRGAGADGGGGEDAAREEPSARRRRHRRSPDAPARVDAGRPRHASTTSTPWPRRVAAGDATPAAPSPTRGDRRLRRRSACVADPGAGHGGRDSRSSAASRSRCTSPPSPTAPATMTVLGASGTCELLGRARAASGRRAPRRRAAGPAMRRKPDRGRQRRGHPHQRLHRLDALGRVDPARPTRSRRRTAPRRPRRRPRGATGRRSTTTSPITRPNSGPATHGSVPVNSYSPRISAPRAATARAEHEAEERAPGHGPVTVPAARAAPWRSL